MRKRRNDWGIDIHELEKHSPSKKKDNASPVAKNHPSKLVARIKACKPGNLRKQLYDMYLRSARWKGLRGAVMAKGKKCSKCGSKSNIQIHHKSYEHLGTKDEFKDLIQLCRSCHKKEHRI